MFYIIKTLRIGTFFKTRKYFQKMVSEKGTNNYEIVEESALIQNQFGLPLENVYQLAAKYYRGLLVFTDF